MQPLFRQPCPPIYAREEQLLGGDEQSLCHTVTCHLWSRRGALPNFTRINRLIEIQFTYHLIHLLNMYSSMFFSILSCTNFGSFSFCPPEVNSVPISSHLSFLFSSCTSPRQPQMHFLFLWIYLFWMFHANETRKCVIFCDWLLSLSMFSGFIHIVVRINSFLWPIFP